MADLQQQQARQVSGLPYIIIERCEFAHRNRNQLGVGTGLIVAFDTWDNGGFEAPAIEMRWGGAIIARDYLNADQGLKLALRALQELAC